ncbi:hypothetical protein V6N13_008905 [Hibiscus sabdariffa]|uniref:Uncharacterized protein n=2 Tax=Hibiscus sabdariffa TaxID=183260 RepID=A0ABR1ZGI7_9ROSI
MLWFPVFQNVVPLGSRPRLSLLYNVPQLARGEIEHPLLNSTPHQLVTFLELDVYRNNPSPDLENICVYKPRFSATHVPRACLPTSIRDSKCKIVHICRNSMDMFISLWIFTNKFGDQIQAPPCH